MCLYSYYFRPNKSCFLKSRHCPSVLPMDLFITDRSFSAALATEWIRNFGRGQQIAYSTWTVKMSGELKYLEVINF